MSEEIFEKIEHRLYGKGDGLFLDSEIQDFAEGIQLNPKSLKVIENCIFEKMVGPTMDGITISGSQYVLVKNCTFDNTLGQSPKAMDELASVVNGGRAIFYRCKFQDNGKAVLIGSGDTNRSDRSLGQHAIFYECLFQNVSRRSVFAQIGQVEMIRCVVENWGVPKYFHSKSYGCRAGDWGQLMLQDCVFLQEDLWTCLKRGNLLRDTFGHYFWPLPLMPGFARAAYADRKGQIVAYHCYKNHPWLYIQNHRGDYMDEVTAMLLRDYLVSVCGCK